VPDRPVAPRPWVLADLLQRLDETLKQAPQERAEEAVAVLAAELVEKAKGDKPNPRLLKVSAKGLKDAAAALAGVVPAALAIASEIVEMLGAL
jgi:hypothetical protein